MVTVGSDGSNAGLVAVGWAGEYARLWGSSLRIVMVGAHRDVKGPIDDARRQISREEFQRDQRLEHKVEAAFSRALGYVPEERIATRVVTGEPVQALIRSAGSGPLVVGTRRLGFLFGTIAGSVSRKVLGRAHGPVVVVPGAPPERRKLVIAGVDGGESTGAVVSFAAEEARVRGAELLVYRALGASSAGDHSWGRIAAAIEDAKRSNRKVRVLSENRRGEPVALLVGRSAQADLLVVGTRSLGPTAGLLHGSVGQRLTVRAKCPVAVIPA